MSLFSVAQCRFRPDVSRPLDEQSHDKQGRGDAERSEADDMPWVSRQKILLGNDRLDLVALINFFTINVVEFQYLGICAQP